MHAPLSNVIFPFLTRDSSLLDVHLQGSGSIELLVVERDM
jgi:hypothetical protein